VELWDLVSAFDRLLRATLSHQQNLIAVDDTPLHVRMDEMLQRLCAAGTPVEFNQLFTGPHSRSRLIGLFLALLELIKMRKIFVEQQEPFGPITVRLAEASATAA
jgi:segregation and condensation protein A